MRRFPLAIAILAIPATLAAGSAATASVTARTSRPLDAPSVPASTTVWFERNAGQADPRAGVVARAHGVVALLTGDGAILRGERGTLGLRFVGAAGRIEPQSRSSGASRYLVGNDRSKWLTNVPHFAGALVDEALPGIDVRWRGDAGDLRFDVEAAPGADVAAFRLAVDGADRAWIDADGRLVADVGGRTAAISAPVAWQEKDGRKSPVAARWTAAEGGVFAFDVTGRDPAASLVIDPTISAGTLLGTTKADTGTRVCSDASGALYLCGTTASASFPVTPTSGALTVKQVTYGEPVGSGNFEIWTDGFVANIAADGQSLTWATYLGGNGIDAITDVQLDSGGNLVLCGNTASANFPTVNTLTASGAGFLCRLSGDGTSLVTGTLLTRAARRVAINGSGDFYVLAEGAPALVTKFDSAMSFSPWATQVTPASGSVFGRGLAIDGSGNAWACGYTTSTSSTLATSNAFDTSHNGGTDDGLVWSCASADGTRDFTTFLGGSGEDRAESIAFDPQGPMLICGSTTSSNFPNANAFTSQLRGARDGFITKISRSASTSSVVWSAYVGGDSLDTATAVHVGPYSDVYVAGETDSTSNFPLVSAIQGSNGGGTTDAFLTRISQGGVLVHSSYVGGGGADTCSDVFLGPTGRPTLAGTTTSSNFPVPGSSFQTSHLGGGDAYVCVVEESTQPFGDVTLLALSEEGTEATAYNTSASTLPLTGGHAPLSFALHLGQLPPGISLSSAGILSGTPQAFSGGDYRFIVRVRDADAATVTREYSIHVGAPPRIATTTLEPWTVGRPFDQYVQANDGRPPFTWALNDAAAGGTGRLPDGMTFDSSAHVEGTPTESGNFSFGVRVTDTFPISVTGVVALHINERPEVDAVTFGDWTEGRPYTKTVTGSKGTPPYTWSVASGTLPVTSDIDANTGVIQGTLGPAGDYTFEIAIQDSTGAVETRSFAMHVNTAPAVSAATLPPALAERPYRAQLAAGGGSGTRTWSLTADGAPPDDFAIDAATGVVTGTAGTESFDFGVKVTDAAGAPSATAIVHVDVVPFFALTSPKSNPATDDFAVVAGPTRRYIELLAGTRLDGTFRLVGKGVLGARLRLFDAVTGEEVDLTPHLKGKGSKKTLSKVIVPATGRFFVIVEPDVGFQGKVETNLRAVAQTTWKGTVSLDPLKPSVRVTIATKVGSLLSLTVVRAKKSQALPTVLSIVDSQSNQVMTPDALKATKTGAIVKLTEALPVGNVSIAFQALPISLQGDAVWTVKLKGSTGYDVKLLDLVAGDPE